jgi:hypothetical protein
MPFSISSNNMRFLLSFRLLAMLLTCFASRGGRLTLCRTAFSAVFITPLCTKMVYWTNRAPTPAASRIETGSSDRGDREIEIVINDHAEKPSAN